MDRRARGPRAALWTILAVSALAAALASGCDEEFWFGDPDESDGFSIPSRPRMEEPSGSFLFGVAPEEDGLLRIDPSRGTVTVIGRAGPGILRRSEAIAVRPSDQALFAWSEGSLLRVDRCTGISTPVAPLTGPQGDFSAMAFNEGSLFAFGFGAELRRRGVFRIRTDTGSAFRQGLGGIADDEAIVAMTSDPEDTLFAVVSGRTGARLVTMRAVTGEVEREVTRLDAPVRTIAFDDLGRLFGAGTLGLQGPSIFRIDPSDGMVSGVLSLGDGPAPDGMEFAPACP